MPVFAAVAIATMLQLAAATKGDTVPASATDLIVLENAQVRAAFDPATGALVQFLDKGSGWEFQGRAALAQVFNLVVPLPERLLHVIDGAGQRVSSARVNPEGSGVMFVWDRLVSDYVAPLDICARAVVTLREEGLVFEMELENRSPYTIESVAYPYIGDLQRPPGGAVLTRANFVYCNMNLRSLYPAFDNERGYWGVDYPIQMVPTPESPFVLVLAEADGLYIGCHDTEARERVEFTFQLKPGHAAMGRVPPGPEFHGQTVNLEFMATHLPFVQPGERYTLAPIVFRPFRGDWHAGADLYKAWRRTWMKAPPAPDWLRDIHAWQQLQMTSWGDTLRVSYNDLVAYGEECARNGVTAIQLVGWTRYGQDGRLPNHDIDPRLGTWDELKRAIEKLQALGVKVILYEKYTCADVSTPWYQSELHRYASKDIFGNTHGHQGWQYHTPAHLAGINTRPYAWMCMNAPAWQDVALREVEKSLQLDPDGILLDECQWHGANAFYCFDSTHGHRVPAYNFGGDAQFEQRLRALCDSRGRSLVVAGEGCYDLQNRAYNLTYHRTLDRHMPAMRYIDPFLPMMNWVFGYDDRENINNCLLYRYIISYEPRHFKGRLAEFPATLAYGRSVDALRRRYRAYLWDAEFRDTVGAAVTVDGRPHGPYTVFRQPDTGKLAVAVANMRADAPITVQVEAGTGAEPGAGRAWLLASPDEPAAREHCGPLAVPPRSVAVLMEP